VIAVENKSELKDFVGEGKLKVNGGIRKCKDGHYHVTYVIVNEDKGETIIFDRRIKEGEK
jgi:hypothetical protein